LLNVGAAWPRVEVLTSYQLVMAEMQVRARFQQHLNDPEPYALVRSVGTLPILPGAPSLQSIPEGILGKEYMCAVRLVEPEPPHPDALPELVSRYIYFQGAGFTAKGTVEFPAGADPTLHREMLFKARFFPIQEATLSVIGLTGHSISWPLAYLNRDLMVAVYLD
jgi:hypothetical protein